MIFGMLTLFQKLKPFIYAKHIDIWHVLTRMMWFKMKILCLMLCNDMNVILVVLYYFFSHILCAIMMWILWDVFVVDILFLLVISI